MKLLKLLKLLPQSKGLKVIAEELGFKLPNKIKVAEVRKLL